jgi:hypothetical protein
LVPVGDTGTFPHSVSGESAEYPGVSCDSESDKGDGCRWWFFYIDKLAKAHLEINNALHKAWLDKFKKPMSAEDLGTLPDTFNAEAKHWYKATIGYMQNKLTDVERGLQGCL